MFIEKASELFGLHGDGFDAFDFHQGYATDHAIDFTLHIKQQLAQNSTKAFIKQPDIVTKASSRNLVQVVDGGSSDSGLNDVVAFLESKLNEPLPTKNLHVLLKDGIILCRLMNVLSPGSILSISTKEHPYQQLQNIHNFLKAARKFGVDSTILFLPADLTEAKDMHQVVMTLLELARLAKFSQPVTATMVRKSSRSISMNLLNDASMPPAEISNVQAKADRKTSRPRLTETPDLAPSKARGSRLTIPDIRNPNIVREYIIGDSIGRGQFATVFKGMNSQTGEVVAVKRIPVDGDVSANHLSSILKEVDILRNASHENVIKYEGFIQQEGFVNIVMEYVECGSLWHLMKQFGGTFPEILTLNFTYGVLNGLAYLHLKNIVHCDLKPANILYTKQGQVKLSDFGISRQFEFDISDSKDRNVNGTPNYLAPEVIELKGFSAASDVWAVGCSVVELITGKPPFDEFNPMTVLFKIVEEKIQIPQNTSMHLQDFLKCCFEKDPEKRPSARMLLHHNWLKMLTKSQNITVGNKSNFHHSTSEPLISTGDTVSRNNSSIVQRRETQRSTLSQSKRGSQNSGVNHIDTARSLSKSKAGCIIS